MKTIYYKVVIIYETFPFKNEVKESYCEFYEKTKSKGIKRFKKIIGLKIDSNTTVQEKENYIKEKLQIEKVEIIKLKF